MTAFGTRWIELLLEPYNASGAQVLANVRRHNGLKPSLLTPEMQETVRLRLADGGWWPSRKVADIITTHLGLEKVAPRRGWEASKPWVGRCTGPRPRI